MAPPHHSARRPSGARCFQGSSTSDIQGAPASQECVPCPGKSAPSTKCRAFEVLSKRRKSFPSETHVKRGRRIVHGDVELTEKLGRNDLCPCGSGRRFQALLPEERPL